MNESSVEIVIPLDGETFDVAGILEDAMGSAHEIGVQEARRRNQEEGIQ
jgi:hypothetical protein